jgi:hypothetical protein
MSPESGQPDHAPLSQKLESLLALDPAAGVLTPNGILLHTEGRGLFLLMILLCLPFLAPVSIPGVSSFSGGVVMIMALRMAFGRPVRLPRWIGDREMASGQQRRFLQASVRALRCIEKVVKPRRSGWLSWRSVHAGNSLLLAFMAFLLALPLLVPFTNTFPAYAIVLLAISMMEEDGLTVWLGYGTAALTVGYFALTAGALVALSRKYLGAWFS